MYLVNLEGSFEKIQDERKYIFCPHKKKFLENNTVVLEYPKQNTFYYENLNRIGGGGFGYVSIGLNISNKFLLISN